MTPAPAATPPPSRPWYHWGLVVAGLYIILLVVLTLPLIAACFPSDAARNGLPYKVYATWQYWILIALLVLSQLLLLRVPVRLTMKRPVSRRAVWVPIVVSGFWMGCLVLGLGSTLMELFKIQSDAFPWSIIGLSILSWIVWTLVFIRITRVRDAGDSVRQQAGWLLKGSILELLVAVPSHIVARGRTDCCAGLFTFFGITMGVSVMLLAFGPAVFVLYYARWRRLKRPAQPASA